MNLLLSDDYLLQDYPENITNSIRSGHSTCVRFNRQGDYLASGRGDGTVVIWDIETMGVARKLRGHSKQIQSLSWSRCGRYLLSVCIGWKAVLWDLKDGKRYREVRFRAPVYGAEIHPWNHHQFAAALFETSPVLVDVTERAEIQHPLPSVPKRREGEPDFPKQTTTAIIYTATGDHILTATSKGRLNIIDTKTKEIIFSEKIAEKSLIVALRLTESGKDLLVNSNDGIIRTFHVPNLSAQDLDPDTIQLPLEHKFQDVVNKLRWGHVTFSASGEYVAASAHNNHELYIWERGHGSLVRMLEGPKEESLFIEWHPHKPLLVACGTETGRINIWSVTPAQKWSALAPDFAEVEDNVEYIEKEDEFDIHPHEEIQKRRLDQEEEDLDVLAVASGGGRPEETSTNAFPMPILFDLGESDSEDELVHVGFGTLRRKSPGDQDEGDATTGGEKVPAKKKAGGRTRKR
ncbi:SWD1-like protein [Podospora fimiseda]|uniref:SWD1-like protein n=1 Tax=Podospora fimiseda TaxID=252190 RepID=A0AAN7H375_9PEZI|nr:SWD1-like protein [Podospora fimiseda]